MTAQSPFQRPPTRQWLTLSAWAVLLWGGCSSRGQMELLEAEIRQHQDALRRAEAKASDLEAQLSVARSETELLRTQMARVDGQAPLPEQTGAIARLTGVKINTLLSGGKDRDGQPGDDVLVALVAPHDQQGDLVKIAGEVEIEAFDMTLPSEDKRVGRWTYTPEEAAKVWHSGFVGAGLQFELPWQALPAGKELIVHARLRTTDGRQFDTSTPLKVVPPVGASQPPGLLPVPAIQAVKHEVENPVGRPLRTEKVPVDMPAEMPATPIVRPVPMYDDVEPIAREANPGEVPRPFPRVTNSHVVPPVPAGKASLDGVQTSDNWTDETIPRLR